MIRNVCKTPLPTLNFVTETKPNVMETKKLKFQTVAAGNQGTVDATIVEGENKENNAAKTAGMAAAGIAAGAAVGYAGYEAYQQFAGTVEAEPMTADEALDAVAGLTADNTVTEPVVEAQPEPVVAAEPVAETQPAATTQHTTTTETTVNPDDVSDEILAADIIDPTDAQASDFPFEVGEIAQVYNVNGELETTTTITAEDGTEMVLVDVNGDQMFDVARDAFGNEVELGVVSTVSDMEMLHAQQQGDTTGYLAASDTDPMPDDNSFEADIIDPTTLG